MRSLQVWAKDLLRDAKIELGGNQPGDPKVHDPRLYFQVLLWGSLALGNGYMKRMWECEQLDVFFDKVQRANTYRRIGRTIEIVQSIRDAMVNNQSMRRAFQVGVKHYDLGNGLYEKMLGNSMGYSSGYYGNGATSLDEAQYAKFDLVCKKLGLKKGMRVLEIGCGWGTFAEHAARHYGVSVVGLSVSKEQTVFARERCKGLPVEILVTDYRTLPQSYNGTFDRAVSIEMIEAVGPKNFKDYMKTTSRALKEDGTFLMQAILGAGTPDPWISEHIFPNGVLPSMKQLSQSMEGIFDLVHLECFGNDYDKTLLAWNKRFEEHWNTIKEFKNEKGERLYDDTFYRMWRYYLLCCAGTFRSGVINVGQLLLTKRTA